jgi:hypothetical protein
MAEQERIAEVAYSPQSGKLELTLPHGTRLVELGKYWNVLLDKGIARLPRGCQACTSGDHLLIRERLEHVINVDLGRVQGGG